MINLSIIIPIAKNNRINQCLESIAKNQLGGLQIEVIIVAFSRVAINQEQLDHNAINLKIIPTEINHPSKMRNLGVAQATGEFLVFFDDDVAVPIHWLSTCHQLLKQKPLEIVCGPNIDRDNDWGHVLANDIQSLYITEGLKTHEVKNRREVNFHNIPLNNCGLSQKIFKRVGGFNEEVDYYLDDVEFFYICHKLGYRFQQYPELAIQHYCRRFPWEFLRYKFYARKKIGRNAFFFPELYRDSRVIVIIFFSYLIIPLIVASFLLHPLPTSKIFLLFATLYLLIVILSSLKMLKRGWRYGLIILGIFLTHLVSYIGFASGLILGLASINQNKKIKIIKAKRYAVFN